MKSKFLLILGAFCMSASLTVMAADYSGTVNITPENPDTNVGVGVELTADWSTNKDITRWEWIVDSTSQGVNTIAGAQSGSQGQTFTFFEPGEYEVCFHIWHHQRGDTNPDDPPWTTTSCTTIVVADQECNWAGETAWSDGDPYNQDQGNWATFTAYTGEAASVTLFAGQILDAGTVDFSAEDAGNVTITITLAIGWKFVSNTDNVKIQDYEFAPSGNPSPGQFDHKDEATASPFQITVPINNFYGVHVDVEECR